MLGNSMYITNLILDKIDKNKPHVFYNSAAKTFEFKYENNIKFITGTKKLFNEEKIFIENSEEEIIDCERISEDFIAHFVKINTFNYKRLLQEIAKYHKKKLTEATEFYAKNALTILPEAELKELNELGDFIYFISIYKELCDAEDYKDYAYYFYIEKP